MQNDKQNGAKTMNNQSQSQSQPQSTETNANQVDKSKLLTQNLDIIVHNVHEQMDGVVDNVSTAIVSALNPAYVLTRVQVEVQKKLNGVMQDFAQSDYAIPLFGADGLQAFSFYLQSEYQDCLGGLLSLEGTNVESQKLLKQASDIQDTNTSLGITEE